MKNFTKEPWKRINSRAGFTLVELIVVMVILAILATVLTPAMLGWIDRAKEKQILLEARNIQIAAMSVAAEEYGIVDPDPDELTIDRVSDLSGVEGTITKLTFSSDFEVEEIVYVNDGFTAVFDGDEWTIAK